MSHSYEIFLQEQQKLGKNRYQTFFALLDFVLSLLSAKYFARDCNGLKP